MYTWTLSVLAMQPLPNLLARLRFQHHITVPLLRLILSFFLWKTSVCFAVPSLVFSLALPLSTFPSLVPFFHHVACWIAAYCSFSLSDKVMWGLLSPSQGNVMSSLQKHFSASSRVCMKVTMSLPSPTCLFYISISPYFSSSKCHSFLSLYTSFSRLPSLLSTSPSLPSLAEWGAECWHWVLSKYVVYGAGRW